MKAVATPAVAAGADAARESGTLRQLWNDAARDWDMPSQAVTVIAVAPFLVLLWGVAAALAGKGAYKALTREDGIAEWLQVFFYAASLGMCAVLTRHLKQTGQNGAALLYLGVCLGLVFLIGEELSWGQRVFGWGTPEVFRASNKQDETNLHNIHGVGAAFKWIQMLVGAYGTLLPLLLLERELAPRWRGWARFLVPHWLLVTYFAPIFVWRFYRNVFEPPHRFYFVIEEYNEMLELCLAMAVFLFMLYQLRALARARAAARPSV
jgi:hypothetical protein